MTKRESTAPNDFYLSPTITQGDQETEQGEEHKKQSKIANEPLRERTLSITLKKIIDNVVPIE
tara:strand:+ start:301 stop:489 length:189 start_codon:yes stop_codon:yes gene_type:complete